jgi:Tol biopolymer transport system component
LKNSRKTTLIILLLSGIVLLAGGLVWVLSRETSPAVPLFVNQDSIGMWGPVRIDLPLTDEQTQDYEYAITPEMPFRLKQYGRRVELWFSIAAEPQVTYTLNAQPLNPDKDANLTEWQFTPRSPAVVYMILQEEGSDLWVTDLAGGDAQQLTATNGSIRDYAVSFTGDELVFSVPNSQSGADLWAVNRDGSNMRQLAACGSSICSGVEYLPFSDNFAFIRLEHGTGTDITTQILFYDAYTAQISPLYRKAGGTLSDLNWAPDGSLLAFVDDAAQRIMIYTPESGETVTVDCQAAETGGWSPDGSSMTFACVEESMDEPCKALKVVDLPGMQIGDSPMYAIMNQREYSPPAWSPDGKWIIFGERCYADRPTRQLWLVDAGTYAGEQITNDVLYNFANYHWDAASSTLVLQRYEMGSATAAPDVMVWRLDGRELEELVDGGHSPNWLP